MSSDRPNPHAKPVPGDPCRNCIAWGPTAGLSRPSVPCPVCKRRVAPTVKDDPAPPSNFALHALHRMRRAAAYNKRKKT